MFKRLNNIDLWVRRYPIAIFQLAVFAIHHETSLAWVLLICAPIADRQFRRAEVAEDWCAELWKVLRFVHKHSKCTYQRFNLSQVVDEKTAGQYQERVVSKQWKWRGLESRLRSVFRLPPIDTVIVERTRLYTVGRGGSALRPSPSSFITDIGGFIFLSEPPDRIKGVYRFYLLHELGHLSPFAKYTWRRARKGCAPFFALYFWVLPQLLLPRAGYWTFAALIFSWFALKWLRDHTWSVYRRIGVILDEIDADRFAYLTLLSNNRRELVAVANFFERWPMPPDPTIPADFPGLEQFDAVRRDLLAKNFAEARKRRGKVQGYFALPQPSKTEWAVWFSFAIAAAFVAVANPPNCNSAFAGGALSFVPVYLTTFMYSRARRLEEVIESALTGDPSIPADKIASWPVEPRWQKQLRELLGYEDEPLDKTFVQQVTGSALGSIMVLLVLMLCAFLNTIPSQSWCLPN